MDRFGTAFVLELGDEQLMIDCGPATVYKMVRHGLWPTRVDHLFLTHLHFDHLLGYPSFLLIRFEQSIGDENPLKVWGPEPTQRITDLLIGPGGVFEGDINARTNIPASLAVYQMRGGVLPRLRPRVSATDVTAGPVVATGGWKATATDSDHHQPWLKSLAYRIDHDGGSIAFTGDTIVCESVAELIEGVDVLVANVWGHQEVMDQQVENYTILGTITAAEMAQEARVKRLIVAHTTARLDAPGSREKAVADMARIFGGEIVFSEEYMSVPL